MTRSDPLSADAAGLRTAVLVSRHRTETPDARDGGARPAPAAARGAPR
ncbi:MAG: hypothetical protein GY825_12955, partial [Phycisphaeraceae bacterium]|nr:hypothetical protein [Phycisphaeraceae bacterium]